LKRAFGAATEMLPGDPGEGDGVLTEPPPVPDVAPAAVTREPIRTRFSFTLPRGYVDGEGQVHREGIMRLATARDELLPLVDDRVRENPAFLSVVLLGRVIEQLGTLKRVDAFVIEELFASDLAFLQDLYRRINAEGHTHVAVTCPACQHEFSVDVAGDRPGES
jgi:hypothetical protein